MIVRGRAVVGKISWRVLERDRVDTSTGEPTLDLLACNLISYRNKEISIKVEAIVASLLLESSQKIQKEPRLTEGESEQYTFKERPGLNTRKNGCMHSSCLKFCPLRHSKVNHQMSDYYFES